MKHNNKKIEGKNRVGFWTIFAVIISLLSAGFAAYSTYKITFSSFDLQISIGHPLMGKSSYADSEHYSLTPIVPIEFLNIGAKPGEVKDIVIAISAGLLKWTLQAELFCKDFGVKAMKEEYREVVHPFILYGKERIVKYILFNPGKQPDGFTVPKLKPDEMLPEGPYIIDFYVSAGDDSELKLLATKKYDMPKNVLLDPSSNKGGVYFPFDESLVGARKAFEQAILHKKSK